MELENRKALIFISLVIIASGCTGGGNTTKTSSSSISVLNFSAFPQSVYSNQQERLTLEVKNTGDRDAKNVAARLFNVPFTGENKWDINQGSTTEYLGTMKAAEPDNNLPARSHTISWSMEAPGLQDGVSIPYNFMSRIFYKYSTLGKSEITLMSQDRFRESGKVGRPTLDNSAGPIQMQIRTEEPIVFYPSESDRTTEMCVIVKNTGSGTAFLHSDAYKPDAERKYDVKSDNLNKIKLKVFNQGRISFEAIDQQNSDLPDNVGVVDLIRGGSGIQCFKIHANNWETTSGPQETIPITMTATYGYYKDTSTSVMVKGSSRFGGSDSSSSGSDSSTSSGGSDSTAASSSPGV
ncbi:MAG: hypothetical protein ABEJ99_04550 [Candidatus Nanohaloarchaea archaeon]